MLTTMAKAHCISAFLILFTACLLTTACAAPSRYYGIDLTTPARSDEQRAIQSLASRAQAGDKQAQLDLGIRFEEGRGVARDVKVARKLYFQASEDTLNEIEVYQVDANGVGGFVKVAAGTLGNGLPEAKMRLKKLEAFK